MRRCGMLVAEEVAKATGKKLAFGDWEGEKDGKPWCRQIRELGAGMISIGRMREVEG